jgi:hypothetical protein
LVKKTEGVLGLINPYMNKCPCGGEKKYISKNKLGAEHAYPV